MLIGFRLRNFRSFLGDQALSYITSHDRTHESTHCIATGIKAIPRLSRSALIFGPNASGKSNLLAALSTLRDLVLNSTSLTDARFAALYTPFQLGPSRLQPTEFEIDVLHNRIRYRYSISYNAQRVISEQLLVYRTGKSQRWFERRFSNTDQADAWETFSPNFHGPREVWRKATRPKALFLTTAAQLNSELLLPLFHWFEHCLSIVFPQDVADLSSLAKLIQDPQFKARALRLLHSADIPIDDLRISERDHVSADSSASKIQENAHVSRGGGRPQIEFLHSQGGGYPIWLDAAYEAAGTHRLLGLLGPLLATIDNGKLLAIDEFDTSLHPLLARFVIGIINQSAANSRSAQLLLTSHNTTLMDLDILRRDEIWLVELDAMSTSLLSPLLRSSPRKHEMVAKGYLRGRYGAVPNIKNDVSALAAAPAKAKKSGAKTGSGPPVYHSAIAVD
jgi:hypothetical protein